MVGWIVNGSGELNKTSDGGMTWQQQAKFERVYLRSLGFTDSLRGWIGTLDSAHPFYVTEDGGASWQLVDDIPEPKPEGICGIAVVNDSVVYACGYYGGAPRVIKTTDGGGSWRTIDLSSLAFGLVDCYFFSEDSGFVVGSAGTFHRTATALVLFTANGGSTWQVKYQGTRPGETCWKISFPSPRTGYVSIEAFEPGPAYFLKTTDGGFAWQEMLFADHLIDQQGIGFATENLGWISGYGDHTYETDNGGESWRISDFGFVINRFRFLNQALGYASGLRVYKYSREPEVKVETRRTTFPSDFVLWQNHPNPFTAYTKLRYDLKAPASVTLSVFDANGRMIRTLVSSHHQPGEYLTFWDGRDALGNDVAEGVYLGELTAGGLRRSVKMVVLR